MTNKQHQRGRNIVDIIEFTSLYEIIAYYSKTD